MLMNAFFNSQFSYCPLVWMCHSRSINTKINNLHYRALRMIYRDDSASFEELLVKDESATIHHRNLQSLVTEMFKVTKGLSPIFMHDIFGPNLSHGAENVSSSTCLHNQFYNPFNPKKVNTGLETVRALGPKIWNLVPDEIRKSPSLSTFKEKIKKWVPLNCPCRLCKHYVKDLGFI